MASQGPHALCLNPMDDTLLEPVNCVDVKARKGQFDIITIRPFPRNNILHSARDGKLSVRRHCLQKYHNHTYMSSNRCEYTGDCVKKITAVRRFQLNIYFIMRADNPTKIISHCRKNYLCAQSLKKGSTRCNSSSHRLAYL